MRMVQRAVCLAVLAVYITAQGTYHALEDEDQDGIMNSNELSTLRTKLHHVFDRDASGRVEKDEMRSVLQVEHVSKEFNSLDKDSDSYVSTEELDTRWDQIGAEMTIDEVADWIAYSVQLPQYAQIFRDHFVSGYTFPLLMDNNGERLAELGIASSLHREQIALMMKRKIAQVGKVPNPIKESSCTIVQKPSRSPKVKLQWKPSRDVASHYQLQVQRDSDWHTVSFSKETTHSEHLSAADNDDSGPYVNYRVTTWNSFGRSSRVEVDCQDATMTPIEKSIPSIAPTSTKPEEESIFTLYAKYLFWLDEAILLTLLLFVPLRAYIYGDADFLLRLFRKLPPNPPTRVMVTLDPKGSTTEENPSTGEIPVASLRVSWERPLDNGVDIVCYCVRHTDESGQGEYVKLTQIPLPTSCPIKNLKYGVTYKFTVEATNAHGLISKSAQSTYMATNPVQLPPAVPTTQTVSRDQCYICADGLKSSAWNVSLHYCSVCDQQFCNNHKKYSSHSFLMHCPAINGKCVCSRCEPGSRKLRHRPSQGSNHH